MGRADRDDGPQDGCDNYSPVLDEICAQERGERSDMVPPAQAMIGDAVDLVEDAVSEAALEDHTDAYVIADLKILASSGRSYPSRDASRDTSLDVIRQLLGKDEEDEGYW